MQFEFYRLNITQERFGNTWSRVAVHPYIKTPSKINLELIGKFNGKQGTLHATVKEMTMTYDETEPSDQWYDNLELEIRPLVRMLRDGGWNTISSCGHEMSIEVMVPNMDDIELLAVFLSDHGIKSFRIEPVMEVSADQLWRRWATIYFMKE